MNRPEFSKDQEYWLCDVIGGWYLAWKNAITKPGTEHQLGFAKELLKQMICAIKCEKCKNNYVETYDLYLCNDCLKEMIHNNK